MVSEFLIIGGDGRSLALYELLKSEGYTVSLFGFDDAVPQEECVRRAQVVLLPYPHSVRDGKIRTQDGQGVPFQTFADLMTPGTVIFHHGPVGCVGEDQFRWRLYDCDPFFTLHNAHISAEGAIFELMKCTDETVHSMRCLVTGYGVFGRALTKMLLGIGASVTVAARREEALRLAEMDGAETVFLERLAEMDKKWDAVLNTVPAKILSQDFVASLPEHCLLMELAGSRGGFDAEKAEACGKKVLRLPGIPGRYSPKAAARALMNSVLNSLKE